MPDVKFKWEVNFTTVISIATIFVSIVWFAANQEKVNAVQNTKISANEAQIERGLLEERRQRSEDIRDLKQDAERDRVEMRRQFDKLNDKLDKLVEARQ